MGDVRSTGRPLGRGGRRQARKFLCLAISALALLTVLMPIVAADVSTADNETVSELTIKFVDANGAEIPRTSPLITDTILPFDTETREDGKVYSLRTGLKIDSRPAWFIIESDDPMLDYNVFKVTVGMEGLPAWMDYYGIRVGTDDSSNADLTQGNSYKDAFYESGKVKTFELNKRYSISFYTLEGSQSVTVPENMGGITISLEAEMIPGCHNIHFYSPDARARMELIETRALYENEPLGELPGLPVQNGNDFLGWFDSNDNQVFPTTLVSSLPTDDITAKWEWPKIEHWTDPPVTNPDGSVSVTEHTKITYQDGSYTMDDVTTTTYPGNDKEERHEESKSVDPDGKTTESSESKTDIIIHDDKSQTWNTVEEKHSVDGSSEKYKYTTEYDSVGNMVTEKKEAWLTDTEQRTREYEVNVSLMDDKEMVYRVESIIPETTILDIDNAKKLIDKYDYKVAVVGTYSDSSLIIVPEDVMQEVAGHGYYLSVSSDEQYVAVDDKVVKSLADKGGEVRLWITPETEGKTTEAQRNVIGNRYAFSVTLTVDGVEISELDGYAEISLDPKLVKNGKVLLVNEDGTVEELAVSVNPYSGRVTYLTDHLLIFMVEQEEEGQGFVWPMALIALSELIIIPLAVWAIYRHRRRKNKA